MSYATIKYAPRRAAMPVPTPIKPNPAEKYGFEAKDPEIV